MIVLFTDFLYEWLLFFFDWEKDQRNEIIYCWLDWRHGFGMESIRNENFSDHIWEGLKILKADFRGVVLVIERVEQKNNILNWERFIVGVLNLDFSRLKFPDQQFKQLWFLKAIKASFLLNKVQEKVEQFSSWFFSNHSINQSYEFFAFNQFHDKYIKFPMDNLLEDFIG